MSALWREPLLSIRPMQQKDVEAVLVIEHQVYEFPWTRGIFQDCLNVGYCCWVIAWNERIIGYGVMSVVVDEGHILNVCIHPDCQGRGLGRKLISRLLNLGRQHGAETALLEVRVSNKTALSLYAKLGFVEVGRRRGYYPATKGREDALLLSKHL